MHGTGVVVVVVVVVVVGVMGFPIVGGRTIPTFLLARPAIVRTCAAATAKKASRNMARMV